ncbi:MAG TPA: hypothetical protein VKF38_12080 [Anaerolineaceae bacterium]|nr:hypothetical protein [Anaerolineaceae bacterium]
MKRWGYFFLPVVLLFIMLFLPKPAPAQASPTFSPGLYYGYINFLARTDFTGNVTVQDAEHRYTWLGFYTGRGKLQLRINNSGGGTISVLLPTKSYLSDYYFLDFSKGHCYIGNWTNAESYYFDLERGYPSIGFAFQAPYKPASRGISYTEEEPWNDQGGEVTNCAEVSQAMLPVGRVVIKGNLDMLSTIQFKTIYATDDNIGGTCSLPGWNQSFSFQPFTTPNVYSTSYCQWRVFKLNSGKPQKGNQ